MKLRRIVFAYRRGQIKMGGKFMRVDQLSDIARAHFPENYEITTEFVPRGRYETQTNKFLRACHGAVVIFHKSAASNLEPETRATLRQVAAGICVDHLDIVVGPLEKGFIDVHIAASRVGEAELVRNLPRLAAVPGTQVRHLRHHADPRLGKTTAARLKSVEPGYFGAAGNVDDLGAFPRNALIPEYDPADVDGFLSALSQSNLHLCVRTPYTKRSYGALSAKPFTKGFSAAMVRANVLVNQQVHDAIHYLGEDYPFMIPESSADAIAAGVNKAESAFGTDEWKRGLDRMADMAARISPAEVARELKQIVDLF
jgi:hypothetical protein